MAKRMKITGTVTVQVTVDPNGTVIDAKGINGTSILVPAAEEAVRRWIFDPGKGTVKMEVTVTFHSSD